MTTFLLILGGLILFNFVLLKFSIQSVDSEKSKILGRRKLKAIQKSSTEKSKGTDIAKAA